MKMRRNPPKKNYHTNTQKKGTTQSNSAMFLSQLTIGSVCFSAFGVRCLAFGVCFLSFAATSHRLFASRDKSVKVKRRMQHLRVVFRIGLSESAEHSGHRQHTQSAGTHSERPLPILGIASTPPKHNIGLAETLCDRNARCPQLWMKPLIRSSSRLTAAPLLRPLTTTPPAETIARYCYVRCPTSPTKHPWLLNS